MINYTCTRKNNSCIEIIYGINSIRIMAYYKKHEKKLKLIEDYINCKNPDIITIIKKVRKTELIIL